MENNNVGHLVCVCATELMNAAVSIHKLHLSITGPGSYAAHKTLNELYDALPGHADNLVEGYQGATGEIVSCENSLPKTLNTVEECLSYITELKENITSLQSKLSNRKIINDLDNAKADLNITAYKLKFLQ